MEAKLPQITLSEPIYLKLKCLYYSDTPWVDCYKELNIKFRQLIAMGKVYYPEKNEIELLNELRKYSDNDIKDALDNK